MFSFTSIVHLTGFMLRPECASQCAMSTGLKNSCLLPASVFSLDVSINSRFIAS